MLSQGVLVTIAIIFCMLISGRVLWMIARVFFRAGAVQQAQHSASSAQHVRDMLHMCKRGNCHNNKQQPLLLHGSCY